MAPHLLAAGRTFVILIAFQLPCLDFAIGQRPPQPLHWPRCEAAQPPLAKTNLQGVDSNRDQHPEWSRNLPGQAQPIAIKEQGADDRLAQVIRQRHAPGRSQGGKALLPRCLVGKQHQRGGITHRQDRPDRLIKEEDRQGGDRRQQRKAHCDQEAATQANGQPPPAHAAQQG